MDVPWVGAGRLPLPVAPYGLISTDSQNHSVQQQLDWWMTNLSEPVRQALRHGSSANSELHVRIG
ncbi:hypothetical protein [Pseudoduganella lutea]|uniref:hypothetical protein n=1 Tax=Pseudoduganella lutea TaxID=321985 RepID=UPI0013EEBDF7|nr:hypothetical protein [Pseudoduganella lutea]